MGACILSAGNSTIFGLVVTLHNIIGGARDILTGLDVLLRAMYLTLFDAMLISYSSLHKWMHDSTCVSYTSCSSLRWPIMPAHVPIGKLRWWIGMAGVWICRVKRFSVYQLNLHGGWLHFVSGTYLHFSKSNAQSFACLKQKTAGIIFSNGNLYSESYLCVSLFFSLCCSTRMWSPIIWTTYGKWLTGNTPVKCTRKNALEQREVGLSTI